MELKSSAFTHEGRIPIKYTNDGENSSPPLEIADIPEGTKSLALTIQDPDAPSGIWTHWVVWGIPPATKDIPENSIPLGATVGTNSYSEAGYDGPSPPKGTHKYIHTVYALDAEINLDSATTAEELMEIMEPHIIDSAELMGTYTRD